MKWLPLLFLLVAASDSSKSSESSEETYMDVEHTVSGDESSVEAFNIVSRSDLIDFSFSTLDILTVALSIGDINLVDQILDDPGTDVSANNNYALDFALKYSSEPLIIKVLARVDPSANEDSLLKSYCTECNFKAIAYLLCDPRVDPTRNEFQALIEAANSHIGIFNLLLTDPRVSLDNPFVQVAVKLAISSLEVDQLGETNNLSLMLKFKRTLVLPDGILTDGNTILSICLLAINHGLVDVIDQIQWLLVGKELEAFERRNIFGFLTRSCASRGMDVMILNLMGQAHSIGDLTTDLVDFSLLQACRFGHSSTVYLLLDFAKEKLFTILPLIDSTLNYCRRYSRHVMAKHILETCLNLDLNTSSDIIDGSLPDLSPYPGIIFYAETVLKLRLTIEFAEHSSNAAFPSELVEHLFFLSLDQ